MFCERCSTPMMPVYAPQSGWRHACVKCGSFREDRSAPGNERAGEFAERGLNCFALQDFDEAQRNFAHAARLDRNRPAYLWALLLSEYGIRYCETGNASYTITFWKRDLPAQPLTAQPEYRGLCRDAASEREALRYYQQEADEIDRGLQQVSEMKRESYDVFLCFKDLDENGPTPERQLCDGLYHELRERGLKVFFAPRTLYGKYVTDYEGYIHNALRDAKLLLVVASSGENAASPWVESEWKRFQRWHQGGDRRLMTCIVGNMSPADFPKELQRYQCGLYAKESQLNDRLTLEAIAARIERSCQGGKRRGPNRKAIAATMIAVALVVGGALAWRFLAQPKGAPLPEGIPVETVLTEVPATEVPATEVPTETPVPIPAKMRSDPGDSDSDKVLGSRYMRKSISSIRFEDRLTDAPGDAWDVSEAGDGSVLAWVEPNGELYGLTIAGNGKVFLPAKGQALFSYYENLEEIDFNGCVDTSNVTNMNSMFSCCFRLQSLDLSSFDTSNVTNMCWMFFDCWELQSLDVSGFDTSNVTNMNNMFFDCRNLQSLDLSSFDTSKVTNMGNMFADCKNLTDLHTSSGFVINGNSLFMFSGCPLDKDDL